MMRASLLGSGRGCALTDLVSTQAVPGLAGALHAERTKGCRNACEMNCHGIGLTTTGGR